MPTIKIAISVKHPEEEKTEERPNMVSVETVMPYIVIYRASLFIIRNNVKIQSDLMI